MSRSEASGSASIAESPRPSWLRWQIVALLVAYSFMTWFNRVSMSVAYDVSIKDETKITPEEIGFVYSAFLATYMVFMTPGGWLIDRRGPWFALALMGLGSAVFGALTGLAGLSAVISAGLVLPMLLVIRPIMGIFTAPIYPAASRIVANWMPLSQRGWANGMVQAAAAVGIAFAFPLFGALVDNFGWQISFAISGGVTALVALLWMALGANHPSRPRQGPVGERHELADHVAPPLVVTDEALATAVTARPRAQPPAPSIRRDDDDSSWLTLLRNPSIVFLTLSYAAVGYVEYLFFFWMHFYFDDVLHLGKEASRWYAAVLTLSLALGMILGGWLADRLRMIYGSARSQGLVPVFGLCAGGGLLVLGVLAQDTLWIVIWLSLALGAVGMTEAPIWTMAVELGGRHGGTAAAICNTGGNAGGLIAPIITPLLSRVVSEQFGLSAQAGWQWGISLGSIIAIAGAVLWIWIDPKEKQSLDEPRTQ